MSEPLRYEVNIFYSEEDGGYIAEVPELPYCSAWGESYEEALAQVQVAMQGHLQTLREEGRSVPEPRVWRGS